MTVLLEFREKIKRIYAKTDIFVIAFLKFAITWCVLANLNAKMGYMTRLNSTTLVVLIALTCSFLPSGAGLLFAALLSLVHMYALSMEVAIVGAVIYLLIYLLYLRFTPKEAMVVLLTPLLMSFNMVYVVPIVMGLVGTPASAISVMCGVLAYTFLGIVVANATNINAMGSEIAIAKLQLVLDALLANKTMLVLMAAFAITVIVVYLIRRLSIEHAWTIAITSGVIMDVVILLIGNLVLDAQLSIGTVIIGSVVAFLVAKVVEFFRFCVDYSRTERVQFEDDEYYYYVKAVPKMAVPESQKKVKKINQTTKRGEAEGDSVTGFEDDFYETDYYEDDGFVEDLPEDYVPEDGGNYEDDEEGYEGYEGDEAYNDPF